MKKRRIIIVISVFVILILTVTAYSIWKGQKDVNGKGKWVEKTINKEQMKTDADCGIVSVKMLLDFYDVDVSYKDLEKELNSTVEGTSWKNIKKYLMTLENIETIEFKENMDKAKEYLEKGYPLFICWDVDTNPEWSHYSILISIDKYSVWMLDPEEKKSLSEYSLEYFLPCWKNEKYWFCILEVRDKKVAEQQQILADSLSEFISVLDTNEYEKSDKIKETIDDEYEE